MIDPLKKEKDTIKLQRKIIDANKNKKKLYIIMVNINKKLINKKLKIINTINGNEDNSGAKGSITFLVNCYIFNFETIFFILSMTNFCCK